MVVKVRQDPGAMQKSQMDPHSNGAQGVLITLSYVLIHGGSITSGHYDARPTVTFPAAECPCALAKLLDDWDASTGM